MSEHTDMPINSEEPFSQNQVANELKSNRPMADLEDDKELHLPKLNTSEGDELEEMLRWAELQGTDISPEQYVYKSNESSRRSSVQR